MKHPLFRFTQAVTATSAVPDDDAGESTSFRRLRQSYNSIRKQNGELRRQLADVTALANASEGGRWTEHLELHRRLDAVLTQLAENDRNHAKPEEQA